MPTTIKAALKGCYCDTQIKTFIIVVFKNCKASYVFQLLEIYKQPVCHVNFHKYIEGTFKKTFSKLCIQT